MALHHRGIIHRDLKAEQCAGLAGRSRVHSRFRLGGSEMQRAADMTQTKSGMFAGTPPYAAPEQMFGERTEASDWYAFGTMLFEALPATPVSRSRSDGFCCEGSRSRIRPSLLIVTNCRATWRC